MTSASDGTEDKESEDWDGSEDEEDVDMVSPVVVGTDLDAYNAAASL